MPPGALWRPPHLPGLPRHAFTSSCSECHGRATPLSALQLSCLCLLWADGHCYFSLFDH